MRAYTRVIKSMRNFMSDNRPNGAIIQSSESRIGKLNYSDQKLIIKERIQAFTPWAF